MYNAHYYYYYYYNSAAGLADQAARHEGDHQPQRRVEHQGDIHISNKHIYI